MLTGEEGDDELGSNLLWALAIQVPGSLNPPDRRASLREMT